MTTLPALRIPRSLLDPRRRDLPEPDLDGLVQVELEHRDGLITAIRGDGTPAARPAPLALTPPVEPHAHLDKCFSIQAFPNLSGTMASAMEVNSREALQRTADQVQERAERALERAWRQGIRAIRSHVDSLGPQAAPSWEALETLRQRWKDRLELQLVALVPIGHWRTPAGVALAERVAASGGCLGGVLGPPFDAASTDGQDLLSLLCLAERLGCPVDLHIDESDEAPGRGCALLSRMLRRHRVVLPLTCSHASSMGLMDERRLDALADSLAVAGVGVIALPTTNLWLLGKAHRRTPWQRPQAPIRQLQAAGVEVAVGGDNVQDPWFPGGDFDPLDLLRFALAACHLCPWQRLGLSPFTTAAARILGLSWDGVLREGGPADLLVTDAVSWPELLARPPARRVMRGGRWLPAEDSRLGPPQWDGDWREAAPDDDQP